jgi:hypothetical protein
VCTSVTGQVRQCDRVRACHHPAIICKLRLPTLATCQGSRLLSKHNLLPACCCCCCCWLPLSTPACVTHPAPCRRTDVVEFVSTEHTPRNLLIRAVRRKALPDEEAAKLAQQYVQLRDTWGVQPHLEGLLQGSCAPWL